jgi:membrane protein implicated in regulation of membrane protease activity
MAFEEITKLFTPLEIGVLIILVLYLIFPIPSPVILDGVADSAFAIAGMLIMAIYLYFYVNPVISVLFVFAAYEFLRRINNHSRKVTMIQYTPSQDRKDEQMAHMNDVKTDVLEVDVVSQMAPIGRSDPIQFLSSSYKPITESIGTASTY